MHITAIGYLLSLPEAATGGVLYKKVFLKISQNSQENTCFTNTFEFYEIFKNTVSTEHLRATASAYQSKELQKKKTIPYHICVTSQTSDNFYNTHYVKH